MEEEDWFIGNEVQKNREKLNLLYPISRASVTNWDHMEKVGCSFCGGGWILSRGPHQCQAVALLPGTWERMDRWRPGLSRCLSALDPYQPCIMVPTTWVLESETWA